MPRCHWTLPALLLLALAGAVWYAAGVQLELERLQSALHASRVLVRALDGDTLELDGGEKVRVLGIDTGETWGRTASGGWVHLEHPEPRAVAAAEYTRSLEGCRVRLTQEVVRKDRYGRTLAHVWILGVTPDGQPGNGFDLASELLRRGEAEIMMIPPNTRRHQAYRRLLAGLEAE